MPLTTIRIHPAAPSKPTLNAPCNGCGVCCLLEPCPVGVLLSGQRRGACAALHWDTATSIYRCGAITQPQQVLTARLPQILHGLIPVLGWALGRSAPRWVAAGMGCDCDAQTELPG